ncbi:winged helix-turn-helix domain-containing protein [Mesorhizobium sp. M1406]
MGQLRFGSFELDIPGRRLSAAGNALHLGGKAFDILAVLASRAGEIIRKQELISLVWPDTTVEDGALRVHIVSLRKLLSDIDGGRYIENVPGRGYVFVVAVTEAKAFDSDGPASASTNQTGVLSIASNLPRLASRLIGREEFIDATAEALRVNRLVTISGTGGIGKTSVALAVGDSRDKRTLFVDLAALNDGQQIMPTLASLLGITAFANDIEAGVLNVLAEEDLLLIFDNCEHLIDAVATAVERILGSATSISILATSREPLRVAGERIRQLPSLQVPPEGLSASEALSYSAVQLFIERVAQSSDLEDLDQPDSVLMVASVVRQLDGIPLAIELAASRAASLGLAHLAASLDNPFAILRKGRRTAPPRQQTLRATLDWSYDSLTTEERTLLQDVAVFAGPFTASAAQALSSSHIGQEKFHETFDGLFLKSFLSVVGGDGTYRLLETTRRYALEKLTEAGRAISQRTAHALYCEQKLAAAEIDWKSLTTKDWVQRYLSLVNDVRLAVRWSMPETGYEQYAVALIAKSHVLWVQLGLMSEQAKLVEWALGFLPRSGHAGTEVEIQLRIARGGLLYHTRAFIDDEAAAEEFVKAGEIARAAGDIPKYIQAMTGANSIWTSNGHYTRSIEKALAIRSELSQIPANVFSRMLDSPHFFRGDLSDAIREAEGSIENAKGLLRSTQNTGVGYEQRMIASTIVAFSGFLRGETSKALKHLQALEKEAKELDYAISTLLLLMTAACPVAYLVGDRTTAIRQLDHVAGLVQAHNLQRWALWLRGYRRIIVDCAPVEGLADEFADARGALLDYLVTLAGDRAPLDALDRALSGEVGWSRPELLRLKSERLLAVDEAQSRALVLQSLQLSQEMGASFWELRCALSAFQFDAGTFRPALVGALSKVDDNLTTTDMLKARALLESGTGLV